MLGLLIHKEIRDLVAGRRFQILTALAGVITLGAVYDGFVTYREALEEYEAARKATATRIENIVQEKSRAYFWGDLFDLGYLAHKPPSPLSVFNRGLQPVLGRTVRVKAAPGRRLTRSPSADEPILGVFPPLDLTLVVQVVLGLFALVVAHDAVCGEKSRSTLGLLLSYPVPRYRLLLAKIAGVLIPTLTAFCLPLVLGIAALTLHPSVQFDSALLIRTALLVLGYVLYLAAMVAIGLALSCVTTRPATAFVVAVSFWVVTALVLPRTSLIAAGWMAPPPSSTEAAAKRRDMFWKLQRELDTNRDEWVQAYEARTGGSVWDTPEGRAEYYLWTQKNTGPHQKRLAAARRQLDQEYENAYDTWVNTGVALSRFSPSFGLGHAASLLTGTGIEQHRRYLHACDRHLARFFEWNVSTWIRDQLRRFHPEKYGAYHWDVSDIPRFRYREQWPGNDLAAAGENYAFLLVWVIAAFVLCVFGFLRYDPR